MGIRNSNSLVLTLTECISDETMVYSVRQMFDGDNEIHSFIIPRMDGNHSEQIAIATYDPPFEFEVKIKLGKWQIVYGTERSLP